MREHPVLGELARFGIKLGLDRMRGLLDHLGQPHLSVPAIHVAGTNGKGSVVAFLEAALVAQGLRVGTTTSPHLEHVNERIRVGGVPIEDAVLDSLVSRVEAARREWAAQALPPGTGDTEHLLTYFEMMTAAAFLHFSECELDVVVVEVGLGGRLDATNVVEPEVAVIVTVGIDHTAQLGPDLACIAAEKAGILKKGVPAVVGPLRGPALKVVRSQAAEVQAPLVAWDEQFRVGRGDGHSLNFSGLGQSLRDVPVALTGEHQLQNAGVALAALLSLPEALQPSEEAVRVGFARASNPGRLEHLAPDLLVDSAHNADGAACLAAYLAALPRDRPRTLLLGVSDDKDSRSIVVTLAQHVDRVLTTRCAHPRAQEPGELAQMLVDVGVPVLPAGDVEQALPRARDGRSLVVVAGSIFLAGAVRSLLAST